MNKELTCDEVVVVVYDDVEGGCRGHGVFVDVFDVDVEADGGGARRRGGHVADDDRNRVVPPLFVVERFQRHQPPRTVRRTLLI